MSSARNLAPAAADGFKDASAYDEHRPAYPAEAVQKLLERMRLADRAHARVVEVAAGTGKFTEALAARHEGFEVRAVEPHPDMRRELEGKALRGVGVADGAAEDMRAAVEDGWGDGCVAAQAFHWLVGAACSEMDGTVSFLTRGLTGLPRTRRLMRSTG